MIEDEVKATGKIPLSVYGYYFGSGGWFNFIISLLIFAVA